MRNRPAAPTDSRAGDPVGAAHGTFRRASLGVAAILGSTVLALSGCVSFNDQDQTREAGGFSNNPVPDIIAPTTPDSPADPSEGQQGPPPTGPCVDPDNAVIATCLTSTGGVHPADAEGRTTYVAERTTGNIIVSKRYGPQRVLATIPVDASGDGGLIDFAFSPTYDQDGLIFALITTGSDNRIVRVAAGDVPKPILTGIPKGATGNMGSMYFQSAGELIVATGNAGSTAAADNPSSLAGKVLKVSPFRDAGRPQVVAGGFGGNVALCPDSDTKTLYVADHGEAGHRLFSVDKNGPKKLWQWNDNPQIGGCAASGGVIYVAMTRAKRIDSIAAPTAQKPTITDPAPADVAKRFGHVARLAPIPGGVQLATVNKSVPGAEVKTYDDRVAIFNPPQPTEDRM
jgi:hypothetical protein